MRLLDSPDQVTALKSHPRLVLREPDVEDEAELRFVQTHDTRSFGFGVRIGEWGQAGGQGSSDTPDGEISSDTRLTKCYCIDLAFCASHLSIDFRLLWQQVHQRELEYLHCRQ